MAPDTRSSRHRGKQCQSQDGGQDWGRPLRSANPRHHRAVAAAQGPGFPTASAEPPPSQGRTRRTPAFRTARASSPARSLWTALQAGFLWPRCCSPGCSVIGHRQSLLCPGPLATGRLARIPCPHLPHPIHPHIQSPLLPKYHQYPLFWVTATATFSTLQPEADSGLSPSACFPSHPSCPFSSWPSL